MSEHAERFTLSIDPGSRMRVPLAPPPMTEEEEAERELEVRQAVAEARELVASIMAQGSEIEARYMVAIRSGKEPEIVHRWEQLMSALEEASRREREALRAWSAFGRDKAARMRQRAGAEIAARDVVREHERREALLSPVSTPGQQQPSRGILRRVTRLIS